MLERRVRESWTTCAELGTRSPSPLNDQSSAPLHHAFAGFSGGVSVWSNLASLSRRSRPPDAVTSLEANRRSDQRGERHRHQNLSLRQEFWQLARGALRSRRRIWGITAPYGVPRDPLGLEIEAAPDPGHYGLGYGDCIADRLRLAIERFAACRKTTVSKSKAGRQPSARARRWARYERPHWGGAGYGPVLKSRRPSTSETPRRERSWQFASSNWRAAVNAVRRDCATAFSMCGPMLFRTLFPIKLLFHTFTFRFHAC